MLELLELVGLFDRFELLKLRFELFELEDELLELLEFEEFEEELLEFEEELLELEFTIRRNLFLASCFRRNIKLFISEGGSGSASTKGITASAVAAGASGLKHARILNPLDAHSRSLKDLRLSSPSQCSFTAYPRFPNSIRKWAIYELS